MLSFLIRETVVYVLVALTRYSPPAVARILKQAEQETLQKAVSEFFAATAEQQKEWAFSGSLDQLVAENEPAVRQQVWSAYRSAPIHDAAKTNFESKQVRFDKHLSAYTVK